MHQCIAAFADSGANVVVEHILLDRAWLRDAVEKLSAYPVLFVEVLCPLHVLEQRERIREQRDPSSGQSARQFRQLASLHAHAPYDLTVDTSVMNPEECALAIKQRLEEGVTPSAFQQLQHTPILDEVDNKQQC